MKRRSEITLFQMFFLSFSYVFSGLFLIRETSFLSLWIPLAFVLLYCIPGYFFLRCSQQCFEENAGWISFLSCGHPHTGAAVFAVFLSLVGAVELILSWLAFSVSVHSFSAFLSFSLVAALILPLSIFVSAHGMSVIGRFSELFTFLIVPLVFCIVFFDFAAVDFGAFSENLYAFFVVTPAPILYLFFTTVLQSSATPNAPKNPLCVPVACFLGALTAVFCAFLFLLYGAGKNNIFLLFFGWMASLARLSLLISVCTADRLGSEHGAFGKNAKKQASKN